jgi:site-specific DNA recombinase
MLYHCLVDTRMNVRQIIKRLAAGPWRPATAGLWSNAVVHWSFSDPLYTSKAYANRYAHVARRKPRSAGPRAGLAACRRLLPRKEWIAIPVPAIIEYYMYQSASERFARNSALSLRHNTRSDFLLRCLLTCRARGLAMGGVTSNEVVRSVSIGTP